MYNAMSAMAVTVLLLLCCLATGSCESKAPPPPEVHAELIKRMYTVYKLEDFEHVTDCSVDEALAFIKDKDAIILDVRAEKERAVSIIPGAVDKKGLLAIGKTKRPVIVYCTIGYRSGQACFSLEQNGYVAYNLKGGILSWINQGHEVVGSTGKETNQATKKVHVYGPRWNLVPKGYTAIW